jgi:hypothetical protein
MLLKMGFINLHFGGAVVTDSPSQTVAMGFINTPKKKNYIDCPFPPSCLKKKNE